jgi:hypothetical protein
LIGATNDSQYGLGRSILGVVAVLVPVMLFVKPIWFRGGSDHRVEEENIIEMSNVDE